MPTLREYFELEAGEQIERLTELASARDEVDAQALHAHVRSLRGSAQMAREDHVYRAALGLEAAIRGLVEGGTSWSEDTGLRIRESLEDLEALVQAEPGDAAEERVAAVLQRCISLGLESRPPTAAEETDDASAEQAARAEFRDFARHEVQSIGDTMDEAIAGFAENPMDRELLKRVLRRQRALLGAARLDEIPILAETLRAVEDLSAVIAKINVPVKAEWLDVFRSARDVLLDGHAQLSQQKEPRPIAALSRLRTLHEELLDRYGSAEVVSSAAPAGSGLVQAVARSSESGAAEIGSPPSDPNRRQRAATGAATQDPTAERDPLQRALELCDALEAIVGDDADAASTLAELRDLLRSATSA